MKVKRTQVDNYSFEHVRESALQRYGKTFTKPDYDELNKIVNKMTISGVKPDVVEHETDIYNVEYNGVNFVCVWNRENKCVSTLLPSGTRLQAQRRKNEKKLESK